MAATKTRRKPAANHPWKTTPIVPPQPERPALPERQFKTLFGRGGRRS
jgi:hypothetical protein